MRRDSWRPRELASRVAVDMIISVFGPDKMADAAAGYLTAVRKIATGTASS